MKNRYISIFSCLCCLVFLFSIGTANASNTPNNQTTLSNGFKITFKGVTYQDDNDTSTWVYEVEELPDSRDLDRWVLGIPECASVLSADPFPSDINPSNPSSGLNGVEWNVNDGFDKGTFTIIVEGQWNVGTINVAAKGPNWERGQIAGPVCSTLSEDTVGGSDENDQVTVIIDTDRIKKVKYKFKQAVKENRAGKIGKVFLLLKVSGEPALEPYIFARPSDEFLETEPEGSFVRVIVANGSVAFNFSQLHLSEQILLADTKDLDFDLGDLSGLKGLKITLLSAYLVEETGTFDIIQEVNLDIR